VDSLLWRVRLDSNRWLLLYDGRTLPLSESPSSPKSARILQALLTNPKESYSFSTVCLFDVFTFDPFTSSKARTIISRPGLAQKVSTGYNRHGVIKVTVVPLPYKRIGEIDDCKGRSPHVYSFSEMGEKKYRWINPCKRIKYWQRSSTL